MARENKDFFLTPYGLMKDFKYDEKLFMKDRFFSHFFELQNFQTHMFTYDNLPETIEENYLEMYFTSNGTVAATKTEKGLVVYRGGRSGQVKLYGLGEKYLGTNNDPELGSIERTVGVDCVVGYNNSTMSPDFDFQFYPYVLTEIEKSILFNIRYARLAPIFEAADSKEKDSIETLLNNIDDGKMVNVISENILKELEGGGTKTFNLTDVKEIDKLQYLIKAYEDMKRLFFTKYGLSDKGSGKMAQQTVDEVNGSTSSAFTLPLNMLYYRRKFVEEVNDMFGTEIEVRFSPAWELEYKKFISDSEASDDEYTEDIPEEESSDPSEDESENGSEEESENPSEDESEDESEDKKKGEDEDEA